MPSSKVHQYACKLVFGKPYKWLNGFMDAPSAHLGTSHRSLYHNEIFANVMLDELKDINAPDAVKLHTCLDFHPGSYRLKELIETDLGRVEADAFIWDVYFDYVLGTDSFKEMGRKIAEKTLVEKWIKVNPPRRPASRRKVSLPTVAVKTRKVPKPRKVWGPIRSPTIDLIIEIERRRLMGEKIDALKLLREQARARRRVKTRIA